MDSAQFQLNAELELKHWWFVARRNILNRLIRDLLPPSKTTLILDVGCGTGGNIASLADRYEAVGIDPSATAIQYARDRFPQARFLCGLAPQDCASELASASLVMLNDVLEHVPDDFDVLTSLFAATKPGCYFLITVPAEPKLWSPHDISHAHYRRYLVPRFERLWRDQPVKQLLLSPFNHRLYPIVSLVRSISHRAGKSFGKSGTDLRLPPAIANRMLERLFYGEVHQLQRLLQGNAKPYRTGVSLLAVVQRTEGNVLRTKLPADVPGDTLNPLLTRQVSV